mgnify:CR=1 FL=1
MDVTNCDAGTLYVLENDALKFKVMKTLSMGVSQGEDGEEINLPPVPLKEENVCAYSAIHRKVINIKDVWCNDTFDFSGPKKYDSMTDFELVDELNKLSGVKVPAAIEEIRTAPILHDIVCDKSEMQQTVEKLLGL